MDQNRWQLIQKIFETAIELPPMERESYLHEKCQDDTDLYEEISAMLDEDASRNNLLDRLTSGNFNPFSGLDLTGKRIGPYQILEEIGSGGMGAVYLAKRADGQFEQQVALKLIKPGMHSVDIVNRFERERQILAQLQHPHIARLLDGGLSDEGLPYFSMEYVSGLPIDTYCNIRRLTVNQRIDLIITVCQAVQFAHNNLIIHRDLKPGNIIVTDEGAVKLLDFGIAKVFDEDQDLPALTRTGTYALTPEYSAPEQIRHQRVTTATDVYALGLILYELLTGERPYRFESSSLFDIERVISDTEPERPSSAIRKLQAKASAGKDDRLQIISHARQISTERLRRKLTGDLDNICLIALKKEPERRYGSAEQLKQDLERYLNGLPVKARKESLSYRMQKFTRRHRWGVITSTIVTFLLISVVTYYTIRLSSQRDRAVAEAQKALAVSTFLTDLFKVADPYESKGRTITAREILERGAVRVESELQDQPETRATMLDVIGNVYYSLGLYEEARPLIEKSLAIRDSLFGPDHPQVARSLIPLGTIIGSEGDYESAIAYFNRALAIDRASLNPDDPKFAEDYYGLAWAWNLRGYYAKADTLYQKTLKIQRLHNDPDLGVTLNDLALLRHELNRYDEAAAYFKESLKLLKEIHGEVHPEIATTLYNYAQLLRDMDRIDEAITIHRKVLEMDHQLYGEEHPNVAYSLNGLASLLVKTGNLDEAEKMYRQALAMRRKLLGNLHPDVGYNLNSLGRVLLQEGKYEEAKGLFFKALEIHRQANGKTHPAVIRTLKNIGKTYYCQKEYQNSKEYLTKALEMSQHVLGIRHFTTANTMLSLSKTLSALGDFKQALHFAQTALKNAVELLGKSHSFSSTCRENLAEIYRTQGKFQEADSLQLMFLAARSSVIKPESDDN